MPQAVSSSAMSLQESVSSTRRGIRATGAAIRGYEVDNLVCTWCLHYKSIGGRGREGKDKGYKYVGKRNDIKEIHEAGTHHTHKYVCVYVPTYVCVGA